jgi:hypothetical protein
MNRRSNDNRFPLLDRCNVRLAWLVEGKTGSGLLRRLQMRNRAVVICFNFIGFNILVDEEVD